MKDKRTGNAAKEPMEIIRSAQVRHSSQLLRSMEQQLAYDGWQEVSGSLKLSCDTVELTVSTGEIKEGYFVVEGGTGEVTKGYVLCREVRMECLTQWFTGACEQIHYRFDSSGMEEGEEREGEFLILSNQGEYVLPFRVKVADTLVMGSTGEIRNLFHFAGLARENWDEAVKLFYSPKFLKLFERGEGSEAAEPERYLTLYRGLSVYPGHEQNIEEFLISVQLKQPVEYVLPKTQIVLQNIHGQVCETLPVQRNGWGYTHVEVSVKGSFLTVEKPLLTDADFLGNQSSLSVFLHEEALHEGKNFGMITLHHAYGVLEIPVTAIRNREHRVMQMSRRMEMKRLTAEMMKLYQDFRSKKIPGKVWRVKAAEVIEHMKRISDKTPEVRLFQAHLLITEERYDEAGWILSHIEPALDESEPENYCYYLYLTTLCPQEGASAAEAAMKVEDIYRSNRGSWRVAWLLLYLMPGLQRSASQRWSFLEEQFYRGCTSPVMYLEGILLANSSPTLLMKMERYEIQLLHYGAGNGIISEDLAGHIAYLIEKEKYYKDSLYDVLTRCYDRKPDDRLLRTICTLLIKGNRKGPQYFIWYLRGVERELRVTRLYEYYMMSVDTEKDMEIPRIVLMYFAYQSNLDAVHTACLYAYVEKHREELQELYPAYRSQIDRFILQQLYKGRIDRHLAYLYRTVLRESLLTKDNCMALTSLLFMEQIDCDAQDAEHVIVLHDKLEREETAVLESGRAYAAVYVDRYEILLEDKHRNRYCSGRTFTAGRLMYPSECVKDMEPLADNAAGFDLYVCGAGRTEPVITEDTAWRFRQLAGNSDIQSSYACRVRAALIRHYSGQEEWEELDRLLADLEAEHIDSHDRYEVTAALVMRSFYEKAFMWMKGLDPNRSDAAILLRLCSRMLEMGLKSDTPEMTALAYNAYRRGKYDSYILQHLVEHFEGSVEELDAVRRSAENFAVDTYAVTKRLIEQLLYTGADTMKYIHLLKHYITNGGQEKLETAFLHRCSGLFLMKGQPMDRYVISDIARAAMRGEALTHMCRLAYLEYFCMHRNERNERTDFYIRQFGEILIRENMKLPIFQEYADTLEGAEIMADKTIVLYRGSKETPVYIYYRIHNNGREANHYKSLAMEHMYAGIYSASFVLFAGESLQYFIADPQNENEILDCGERRIGESSSMIKGSRYGLLNDIASAACVGRQSESAQRLRSYLMQQWMAEGLFRRLE